MNEYTITRIYEKPDWSKIPALSINNQHWCQPVDITAEARLCYDEKALYVLLSAKEEHIRAENSGPLAPVYEDSCLEFFFSPMPGDLRYFNIEVNPNGSYYLGFGTNRHNTIRFIPKNPPIVPKPSRTQGGWQVEYSIPWEFVWRFFPEFSPESGKTIRANCYKCGDCTVVPHYITWNPIVIAKEDFHCPDEFGLMIFE